MRETFEITKVKHRLGSHTQKRKGKKADPAVLAMALSHCYGNEKQMSVIGKEESTDENGFPLPLRQERKGANDRM